jgi:protease I
MNDEDAMRDAVRLYHEGVYEGDLAKLEKVFHADARLFGEIRGERYWKTRAEYLDIVRGRVAPAQSGYPNRMKLLALEIRGNVAMAKVLTPVFDVEYVDYLSFVRTADGWQIVSKLFSDAPDPHA